MKKILGMGNALTDILYQIKGDVILNNLSLPKGSMQLIDADHSKTIQSSMTGNEALMATGGSASNTINGVARLGGKAGFIGRVGRDEVGEFYSKDMSSNGVQPHLAISTNASGTCTVLVSPDGERTLCTFLGAAAELDPSDLHADMFTGYDIFHIEGYLVQNHELIRKAVRLAKEAGLMVSIDLASYNVVEGNLDFLKEIVAHYVDIVFANEDEARAFTGLEPQEAVVEIAKSCQIAVVKIGSQGSLVRSGNEEYLVTPFKANCIDTTGAGDLYAAGFLFGLSTGASLDVSGKIASLVSARVVEVLGAKMNDASWTTIKNEISKF